MPSRSRSCGTAGSPPTSCGFCKALGSERGRPTLTLDVGALLGSLVGQSEANVRQAPRLVDATSPCAVMLDGIEKALAGVASGGQTGSGISARMSAGFLGRLDDHEGDASVGDAFVAGTA